MNQQEIVTILRSLHEHVSIGEIIDCLVTVCMIHEQNEGDSDNPTGAASYKRARYLLEDLDHLYV